MYKHSNRSGNGNSGVMTFTPSAPSIAVGSSTSLQASVTSTNSGSISYTWSPATALYSDAGYTTPYVLGQNFQTVYCNTLSNANYTCTATDGSGCTRTGTVTVYVKSGSTGLVSCGYSFSLLQHIVLLQSHL